MSQFVAICRETNEKPLRLEVLPDKSSSGRDTKTPRSTTARLMLDPEDILKLDSERPRLEAMHYPYPDQEENWPRDIYVILRLSML